MTLDTSEIKCPYCGHIYNDTSLQEESTFTYPETGILAHDWTSVCPKCGSDLCITVGYHATYIEVHGTDDDSHTTRDNGGEWEQPIGGAEE